MEKLNRIISSQDPLCKVVDNLLSEGLLEDTRTYKTIELNGVDLEVDFKYIPEEPMVMHCSDGSGHPGSAEAIEEIAVFYKGVDVTELYEDRLDEVENKIWKVL